MSNATSPAAPDHAAEYTRADNAIRLLIASLADWWARHRALAAREARPFDQALLGGFAADRLGYAFASGYQAALRALVPDLPPDRVASLCVTERGGASPRAITTLLTARAEGGYRLDGGIGRTDELLNTIAQGR